MAFLDNSGDIILDAVLTTLGRRRMAQGNFRITKYAFGDDEINYGEFVLATGSAYQDLTILQTPVPEATTGRSANIQCGLLALSRADLLYIPQLVTNEKVQNGNAAFVTSSVYYFAANTETYNKVVTAHSASKYALQSDQTTAAKIMIESGLNGAGNDGILGTNSNRAQYIVNNNLLDSQFMVSCDNRFLAGLFGPNASSKFGNLQPNGQEVVSFNLQSVPVAAAATSLDNYNTFYVNGVENRVEYVTNGAATNVSAINGPRGTATALNFVVDAELAATQNGSRSAKFDLYGTINSNLFGGGDLYDYIDTIVYVNGRSSTAQLQLPIRIIRYAGT